MTSFTRVDMSPEAISEANQILANEKLAIPVPAQDRARVGFSGESYRFTAGDNGGTELINGGSTSVSMAATFDDTSAGILATAHTANGRPATVIDGTTMISMRSFNAVYQ